MAVDGSQALVRGAVTGMLVVFVIATAASLALGASFGIAALVGIAVGFFVGGGLGFLISGRIAEERTTGK